MELCDIDSKLYAARLVLAFPDKDSDEYIVGELMKLLEVERGKSPIEYECFLEDNEINVAKKEILEAIKSSKNSVIRSHHTGDKVAKVLVALVEEMHKTCPAPVWVCSGCRKIYGQDISDNSEDTLSCSVCGSYLYYDEPEAIILETDAFKEADAYVLRIQTVRESKEKK